jgi:hypothetical protein
LAAGAIIAVSAPRVEGKGAAAAEAPSGRLTAPEEAARQITGAAIPIDAGHTAG